jgi:hypothetical protein
VLADGDAQLAVMSIGFLLDREDDAVVWRGPKKTGMAPPAARPRLVPAALTAAAARCVSVGGGGRWAGLSHD